MFDGDEAGRNGMCIAAAKLTGRTVVRTVRLPIGKQPDGLSADALGQLLSPSAEGLGSPDPLPD
jgi:hypothetical protein